MKTIPSQFLPMLDTAFNRMNTTFTSNEFARVARELGVDSVKINKGICADYFKPKCKNIGGRIWQKSNINKDLNEKNAVVLLKKLGYKILKPTFEEI